MPVLTGTLTFEKDSAAEQTLYELVITKRTRINAIWISPRAAVDQIINVIFYKKIEGGSGLGYKLDMANQNFTLDNLIASEVLNLFDTFINSPDVFQAWVRGPARETASDYKIVLVGDGLGTGTIVFDYEIDYEDYMDNLQARYDGTGYNEMTGFEGGAVYCDYGTGAGGTTFPTGTPRQPANTLANAISIAGTNNLTKIILSLASAERTCAQGFAGLHIVGREPLRDAKLIFGIQESYSVFENIKFKFSTEDLKYCRAIRCAIYGLVYPQGSTFTDCLLEALADIRPYGTARELFERCHFDAGAFISFGSSSPGKAVDISNGSGSLIIKNISNASVLNIYGGENLSVTIQASCTAGTINRYGPCADWNDASAGTTVNIYDDTTTSILTAITSVTTSLVSNVKELMGVLKRKWTGRIT